MARSRNTDPMIRKDNREQRRAREPRTKPENRTNETKAAIKRSKREDDD